MVRRMPLEHGPSLRDHALRPPARPHTIDRRVAAFHRECAGDADRLPCTQREQDVPSLKVRAAHDIHHPEPTRDRPAQIDAHQLGRRHLALLALASQRPTALLDPDGTGPDGARALAEVLRDQGVEVDVVRSIGGVEGATLDRDTTVLVADPSNVGPGAADRLSRAVRFTGRLVLVAPSTTQLERLEIRIEAKPPDKW